MKRLCPKVTRHYLLRQSRDSLKIARKIITICPCLEQSTFPVDSKQKSGVLRYYIRIIALCSVSRRFLFSRDAHRAQRHLEVRVSVLGEIVQTPHGCSPFNRDIAHNPVGTCSKGFQSPEAWQEGISNRLVKLEKKKCNPGQLAGLLAESNSQFSRGNSHTL